MILIIGASGFIGNKLYRYFKEGNIQVKGTYFSNGDNINEEEKIYLDLKTTDFDEINRLKALKCAIFCHGISDVDRCEKDQALSSLINVKNTLKLLQYFKDRDVIPAYISTSMIFNGINMLPSESDEPRPILEYGRQKLEVENFITANFSKYIILRLTKVFGIERQDGTIFTSWLDKLLINEDILAVRDIFISPIYVSDVTEALGFLLENQHHGVYNLGGPEVREFSYFAKKVIRSFGFGLNQLKEVPSSSFAFTQSRPHFNSLDSKKIMKCSGLNLTALDKCFAKIGVNYGINYKQKN